jgi:lysozyme
VTDIIEMLKRHEGLKLKPYKDTVGKLTIGYGRNLDDVGISKEEAEMMLRNDFSRTMAAVRNNIAFFDELDIDRQDVLLDMCYNLGIKKLLTFKKMLNFLSEHKYNEAAKEMLDSLWAKQVKGRASELALIMKGGKGV